jgi:hypothetical protein
MDVPWVYHVPSAAATVIAQSRRRLVSAAHRHRFDPRLVPVLCGSTADAAISAPRVHPYEWVPAGTFVQEVFDRPPSNPSSGSFPIIPYLPLHLLPTLPSR